MWMWILWAVRPLESDLWTILEIIVALVAGIGGIIVGWTELKKLRTEDRRLEACERTVDHMETRVGRLEERDNEPGQVVDHETRLTVLETRLEANRVADATTDHEARIAVLEARLEEQRKHYEHRLDEERRRTEERLEDLKRQVTSDTE